MRNVIWIINQYASHLEERHLKLAINFAEKGNSVVVITSSFHHGKHEYIYTEDYSAIERCEGVHFIYLKSKPTYQANGGKRIVNMVDFCRAYLHYQNRIIAEFGRPDFVIASSAPPFMWEIGYKTAKKFKSNGFF